MEDIPVCHIKRLIAEGVLPVVSAALVTIRKASGTLVGQDHSLRYVYVAKEQRRAGLKYSVGQLLDDLKLQTKFLGLDFKVPGWLLLSALSRSAEFPR